MTLPERQVTGEEQYGVKCPCVLWEHWKQIKQYFQAPLRTAPCFRLMLVACELLESDQKFKGGKPFDGCGAPHIVKFLRLKECL